MKKHFLYVYGLAIIFAIACVVVTCKDDKEPEGPTGIPVASVTLDLQSLEMAVIGQKESLKATVSPPDASNRKLIWSSSNLSIVTVDDEGNVTAQGITGRDGNASTPAIITVTTDDGGKTATCSVIVTGKGIKIEKIEGPSSLSVPRGETKTITVTFLPPDATIKTLEWTSDNTNLVTVDKDGNVTAAEMRLGKATITGTAIDRSEKTIEIEVEVTMEMPEFAMVDVTAKGKTFWMGQKYWNPIGPSSYESPAFEAEFTKSYKIGKYPVTCEQWLWVMGEPNWWGSDQKGFNLQWPMQNISWDKAKEFIEKLNEKTDRKYRLPTEAEWEFAAKGGNEPTTSFYGGAQIDVPVDQWDWDILPFPGEVVYDLKSWPKDEDLDTYSPWYVGWSSFPGERANGANRSQGMQPVGLLAPNELGLYDMLGNICEWCEDWFAWYTEEKVVDRLIEEQCNECENENAEGPSEGTGPCGRVYRGGNMNNQNALKTTYRGIAPQGSGSAARGFRLVEDID